MCGIDQSKGKLPPVPLFILYNKYPVYFFLRQATDMMQFSDYDIRKSVVIFIHGFVDDSQGDFGSGLVEAYRERNDHNIIGLDWRDGAHSEYFTNAIPNMKKVAIAAGRALVAMFDHDLDPNRVHIVGHSLGAQMAGIIGNYVKTQSYNKYILKRITALDPAFPGFYGRGQGHLTKYDAQFVDVLHTDSGFFGARVSTGTVDFWANSGYSPQPGCSTFPFAQHACSHSRAWSYFNESILCNIKNMTKFHAIKADSWKDFKRGAGTNFDPNVFFGSDCPANLSGDYFFQTNESYPHAKGKDGCVYDVEQDMRSDDKFADAEPNEADFDFSRGTEMLLYQKYMHELSQHPKLIPFSSRQALKERKKFSKRQK